MEYPFLRTAVGHSLAFDLARADGGLLPYGATSNPDEAKGIWA
jgi:hypothetical protein